MYVKPGMYYTFLSRTVTQKTVTEGITSYINNVATEIGRMAMHKRFHKLAAVVLAVSLALQQGAVPVLAEEVQTETQTQTVTEA